MGFILVSNVANQNSSNYGPNIENWLGNGYLPFNVQVRENITPVSCLWWYKLPLDILRVLRRRTVVTHLSDNGVKVKLSCVVKPGLPTGQTSWPLQRRRIQAYFGVHSKPNNFTPRRVTAQKAIIIEGAHWSAGHWSGSTRFLGCTRSSGPSTRSRRRWWLSTGIIISWHWGPSVATTLPWTVACWSLTLHSTTSRDLSGTLPRCVTSTTIAKGVDKVNWLKGTIPQVITDSFARWIPEIHSGERHIARTCYPLDS